MKLTLKKAIDEREKLTRDLKRNNDIMQVYNTSPDDHKYNIHQLYKDIVIGNQNLEQLKLLILETNANGDMYKRIYALRSLTTQRANLLAMQRRIYEESSPLMSSEEIQALINELDVDIKKLKDELDTFNKETTVEYSPITNE